MMALFMGPLNFYKLVYISVIASTSYSSFEKHTSSSLQLNMNAKDFEYVLTWKTGNNTGMPTCFNVMYSPLRLETKSNSGKKDEGQDASSSKSRIVTECSNITRPVCNLTKEFTHNETYLILVEQVTKNGVFYSYLKVFSPYSDTCLGQPQFNVSSCPNCVNVSVKLSSPLLLEVYKDISYTIKTSTAGFPDKQDDNTTKQESFSVVMGYLLPNRNYCITVDVSTNLNKQCNPSSSKCIITGSKNKSINKSDLIIIAVLLGIFLPLIVMVILLMFYRIGLIFLRTDLPNILDIIPKFGYLVFDSVPEEVHSVKVTAETKKKVWRCDDDDDDDYNNDSGSDVENNHLYSVHKQLKSSSTVDIIAQLSIDGSSPENDTSESGIAEADILRNEINEDESTKTRQLLYDSSKGNAINEPELELSSSLNVNLNSVKLGISINTQDVLASVDPDHENSADMKEPCITSDSESTHLTDIPNVQTPNVHSLFSTWQNPGGSGESESSDSETDYVGDYIKR